MKKILFVLLSLVLASCATNAPMPVKTEAGKVMTPPPPPAPAAAPAPSVKPSTTSEEPVRVTAAKPVGEVMMSASGSAGSVSYMGGQNPTNNILYKAFLFSSDKLNPELTTFIYLPKRYVTDKEAQKYILLCKIWMNSFSSKEELAPHIDTTKEKLVPFYWPVTLKNTKTTCEEMLNKYDYPRMFMLMKNNKLDTEKIQLVAVYNKLTVTMDITPLDDPSDLIESFSVWKKNMTRTPTKSEKLDTLSFAQSINKVLSAFSGLVKTTIKS